MKKLILHVGLPKTATTSLQDNLFVNLDLTGRAKYFGKSVECNNTTFETSVHLSTAFFSGENLNRIDIALTSDRINIISDERFTMPNYYGELKWKSGIVNTSVFPEKLFDYFSAFADEIIVLFTLRKQAFAIYSLYVELYAMLHNYNGDSINGDIFNQDGTINIDFYHNYNYTDLISQYESCFGKNNIKIMLFEDYINDINYFSNELAELLLTEKYIIDYYLKGAHRRKREKTDKGYIRNYNYKPVEIPYLSNTQKQIIYNYYLESNLVLALKFGLSHDKLSKYNYI